MLRAASSGRQLLRLAGAAGKLGLIGGVTRTAFDSMPSRATSLIMACPFILWSTTAYFHAQVQGAWHLLQQRLKLSIGGLLGVYVLHHQHHDLQSLCRGDLASVTRSHHTSQTRSVASLIKAVNESSAKSFASGGLNSIKAAAQPYFPAAAKDTGLSLNAQIALGAGAVYFWHRYTVHASSPDWIVDLSLDVLQAAWWISFLSFLPFRSIYVSLRGIAPASAGPLSALKPTAFIKP
eukprot:366212-Chlamydomonas_euryale.AAC.13